MNDDNNINSNISRRSQVKDAASLLLRGGTMLSDLCTSCKGVLIKYEGKTICLNCGMESTLEDIPIAKKSVDKDIKSENNISNPITDTTSQQQEQEDNKKTEKNIISSYSSTIIKDKINLIMQSIKNDKDHLSIHNKGETLNLYLDILSKLDKLGI